jgi:hypothetical protein
MKIKIFGHGIDIEQCKLIKKMVGIVTNDEPEIIDLKSFDPDVNPDDLIFTYGPKAQRQLNNIKCQLKIEFPELRQLDPAFGVEVERALALKKLLQLKKTLDSGNMQTIPDTKEIPKTEQTQNIVTEELPTQLTVANIEELERQQREQGKTCWSGWTTDGKSIRVTVEPEEPQADIQMTFAELHKVIGLKEAFRVKELEFVYKPNPIRKDSTN